GRDQVEAREMATALSVPCLGRYLAQSATAQATCLSSCLIRLRPAPFASVRSGHVLAGPGRWRTPVNTGQHCWKACWGQPLASSNLASSATSDQAIHKPRSCVGLGLQGCVVSFVVSFILRISV